MSTFIRNYSDYLGARRCCSANANGAQGAAGATGTPGPIGPVGSQGSQGAQGPQGPQGACCRGPQGPAGTSLENSGTANFAGAPSGKYVIVNIAGVDYKIELLNMV